MTNLDQWLKLRDAVSQLDNSMKLINEEVMDKNWTDAKSKKEFTNWYPSHAAILKDWFEMIDAVSNENSKYKSRFPPKHLAGTIRGVGRMLDADFYWSSYREMMNSAADTVCAIAGSLS